MSRNYSDDAYTNIIFGGNPTYLQLSEDIIYYSYGKEITYECKYLSHSLFAYQDCAFIYIILGDLAKFAEHSGMQVPGAF